MMNIRDEFLPFYRSLIGEEEKKLVNDVMNSGWLTTGKKVKEFEESFRQKHDANYAVAFCSATAALHTVYSLIARNQNQVEEVIVPTWTFASTASMLVHAGLKPVLIDVDQDMLMTAEGLEAKVEQLRHPVGVVPVFFAGNVMEDLLNIYELAIKHNLFIVEDAAHATGSTYRMYPIGSNVWHDRSCEHLVATVFSFYATKNITTGEGGMALMGSRAVQKHLRVRMWHGIDRDVMDRYTSSTPSWYYQVVEPGFKYNLTDLQAALGLAQLDKLEVLNKERKRLYDKYCSLLSQSPDVRLKVLPIYSGGSYHLMVVLLDLSALSINRNMFIEELRKLNVGTSVHFIPLHRHPYYAETMGYKYRLSEFPVAEKLYSECVSLPLFPGMTDADVEYVVECIEDVFRRNKS